MHAWLLLLSGLIIWTAHFFGIYITASLFPGTHLARWLTLVITVLSLASAGALLWATRRQFEPGAGDATTRWINGVEVGGLWLAIVAMLYQGLPAVVG